jgi:predicted nucleic acid-binding protein
MNGNRKLVYWDTGIFLALLSNEQREQNEMTGINEQVNLFDGGQLYLCTSVITLAEILQSQLPPKAVEAFEKLTQRRNFLLVNVNKSIAKIAQEIRNYYSKQLDAIGVTLAVPDAIHVATAISRKCEVFYTFDAKDRPGKSRALIPLSGTIAGKYYLTIEKPHPNPI